MVTSRHSLQRWRLLEVDSVVNLDEASSTVPVNAMLRLRSDVDTRALHHRRTSAHQARLCYSEASTRLQHYCTNCLTNRVREEVTRR